jgi:hypothetical protein
VLLQIEKQKIDDLIAQYSWQKRNADLNKDAVAHAAADKRLRDLGKEGAGVNAQIDRNKSEANPNSFSDQFGLVLTHIRELPTLAQGAAKTFETTFTSAIGSISSGISGLIMGTKTWGQALLSIETTIVTSLIDGIVQMGVQWVLTHVIMGTVASAFHALVVALGWSATGEAIAQETAKAPLLATNATTASIGSYGTAALIGVAALVAALGIGIAAATGAFYDGGYTGAGGKYDVAGVVHRGEFVMPASAVDRIGLPALEAQRAGGSGGGSGAGAGDVHVHNWHDAADMMQFIKNNPEFNHHIVKTVGDQSHKILPRRA